MADLLQHQKSDNHCSVLEERHGIIREDHEIVGLHREDRNKQMFITDEELLQGIGDVIDSSRHDRGKGISEHREDGALGEKKEGEHTKKCTSRSVSRLEHCIYAFIVLAAAVKELDRRDASMVDAMAAVGGGAFALVLSHLYSGLVAALALTRAPLEMHVVATACVDQLFLAVPAAIAVIIFLLAEVGAYADTTAYLLAYIFVMLGLFFAGYAIGTRRKGSFLWGLVLGASNVLVGGLIGLLEFVAG